MPINTCQNFSNAMDRSDVCAICERFCEFSVNWSCGHMCCMNCVSPQHWEAFPHVTLCPRCAPQRAFDAAKFPGTRCGFCGRRADKQCLRCEEGCCRAHAEDHLDLPCGSPGHLLVNVGDLHKWTCPKHGGYLRHYCEDEQVGLCQHCGRFACVALKHRVSDIFLSKKIQAKLMLGHDDRSSSQDPHTSTTAPHVSHQIYKSHLRCGLSVGSTTGTQTMKYD